MTTTLIQRIQKLSQAGLDRQLQELSEYIQESDEIRTFMEALLDEENTDLTTLFYQLSGIDIPTPCFNPYHLSPNWVAYLNGFFLWYKKGEVNFEFEKTYGGTFRVKKTEDGIASLYHLVEMAKFNVERYKEIETLRKERKL